jgi:SAM-dependent methyltransferase
VSNNLAADTETIVCDFCGGKDSTVFFVENGCNLTRCGNCGLLYVNPRPLSSQGFAKYSHEYTDYVEKYIQNKPIYQAEAKRRMEEVDSWASGGKLLDIGCADGTFLELAREHGWETTGVEPDEALARHAIDKSHLNVRICDFLDSRFEGETFHAVTASNIICHVRWPDRFFRETARILKKGGRLFLDTGNGAEIFARKEAEIWGEHWGTPDHLFHFSEDLLHRYMERNGLVVEKSDRIPLFSMLFSKDNLRLFKGSKLKSALKSALLAVPPLRLLIVTLFNLYYVRLKKSNVCKLRIVARKA